jgi:hypothetical protein
VLAAATPLALEVIPRSSMAALELESVEQRASRRRPGDETVGVA